MNTSIVPGSGRIHVRRDLEEGWEALGSGTLASVKPEKYRCVFFDGRVNADWEGKIVPSLVQDPEFERLFG